MHLKNIWLTIYLDIGSSFRKNDLHSEVLSKYVFVVMIECIIENVTIRLFQEQVVPRRHVISLTPVSFPLAHDWESWVDFECDIIIASEGVGAADVANVVPVVESADVARQLGLKTLHCV